VNWLGNRIFGNPILRDPILGNRIIGNRINDGLDLGNRGGLFKNHRRLVRCLVGHRGLRNSLHDRLVRRGRLPFHNRELTSGKHAQYSLAVALQPKEAAALSGSKGFEKVSDTEAAFVESWRGVLDVLLDVPDIHRPVR
jgi:hypothetical protein